MQIFCNKVRAIFAIFCNKVKAVCYSIDVLYICNINNKTTEPKKKQLKILIKNGTLVRSSESTKSDILLKAGKIEKIEKNISETQADKVIDATGKYIFPGGIDPHVHMDLTTPAGKSSDSFETGSRAALFGGTTTLIDFVTPQRNQNLIEALEEQKKEAKNCLTDYSFHMTPQALSSDTEKQIKQCIENEGINSFKIYMAYSIGLGNGEIAKVMEMVAKYGGLVTVHAENGEVIDYLRQKFVSEGKIEPKYHPISRPDSMEEEAINRVIEIAKLTNCKLYIVHVSSAKGIKRVEKAQKEGALVYAETCPHYLLLDDGVYNQEFNKSAKYVLSPPIRGKENQEVLWNSIAKNSIQTVGTDHCPFNLKGQKELGIKDFTKIPNGAGGVEHRLNLLYTYGVLENKITLNQFVNITSTQPAQLFGLEKQKGDLKAGLDADIVIWNPEKEKIISAKTHNQNCDTNIYEGFKLKGVAETIILRGEVAVENEKMIAKPKGHFLKRVKIIDGV